MKTAYLGLGCFWSPEARYASIPQVKMTAVGYAGGTRENPTYQALGDHTEITRLNFDGEFRELLEKFKVWKKPGMKIQYRAVVLYTDEEQKEIAEQTLDTSVDIEPLEKFYLAEDYHQKYCLRSSKYMEKFSDLSGEQFIQSEKAMRYNAVAADFLSEEEAERLIQD